MRQFLVNALASLARAVIRKYNPIIIGITGSVGKTSAREAIYTVVKTKYSARKPDKNYNNEIGLPLTILGVDSPYRNPLAWIKLFFKGLGLLLTKQNYPKVLVLEMGIDHTGDMDNLLSIAQPHISVITNIGLAHYEFFKTVAAVAEEKGKIIEDLKSTDFAILNADNDLVMAQSDRTSAQIITYGIKNPADVKVEFISEQLTVPAKSRLQFGGKVQADIEIQAIGMPHVSACAAAAAVGVALEIDSELIEKGLREYHSASGRLNLLNGIKNTVIIEDSYNASPDSMKEALLLLGRMPNLTKVAIVGDMLELGEMTKTAHEGMGKIIAGLKIDELITVGQKGRIIGGSALANGMDSNRIKAFETSDEAKAYVLQNLMEGSAILVKGSQGARMEKISKEILAEPMSAGLVLPRQYDNWVE